MVQSGQYSRHTMHNTRLNAYRIRRIGILRRFGLGFKNALAALKKCGLIQYTKGVTDGVLIDKIGKVDHDSVRGKALVGDGNTYVDLGYTIKNQFLHYKVFQIVETLPSEMSVGFRTSVGVIGLDNPLFFRQTPARVELRLPTVNGDLRVSIPESFLNKGEVNTFEVKYDGSSLSLTVNETETQTISNSGDLLSFNRNLSLGSNVNINFSEGNGIYKLEIYDDGITYTLNIESRQSTGLIELLGSDGSKIVGQQFISPAEPTVNSLQESAFDKLGGSFADGSQYVDQALTTAYDIGTPLPVAPDGLLYAYIDNGQGVGVRASADYLGRQKYNYRLVDGVVDLLTEEITDLGTTHVVTRESIIVTTDGTVASRYAFFEIDLKNIQYTLKTKLNQIQGTQNGLIVIRNKANDTNLVSQNIVNGQTVNINFTPIDSGAIIRFYANRGVLEVGENAYEDFVLFEGTTEPPSKQWDDDNSITLQQIYDGVGEVDNNRILTNADHTNKVLRIGDLPDNYFNQMFIDDTKEEIGFFDKSLTGECEIKAKKFFDQIEVLEVAEGSVEVAEGTVYVGKQEVTQIL